MTGEFVAKQGEYCPAIAVHHPQVKVGSGHVLVEQDARTGTWRRSQYDGIPFVQTQSLPTTLSSPTSLPLPMGVTDSVPVGTSTMVGVSVPQ
jgi:hypothetical protein